MIRPHGPRYDVLSKGKPVLMTGDKNKALNYAKKISNRVGVASVRESDEGNRRIIATYRYGEKV